jgi:hypothetical protein
LDIIFDIRPDIQGGYPDFLDIHPIMVHTLILHEFMGALGAWVGRGF